MKLLLLLVVLTFYSAPTYAYKEIVKSDKEVQITAGEQNTNLYRLNSTAITNMKQLKQMSEAMVRNPQLKESNSAEIKKFIGEEEDNSIENQIAEVYQKVIARTEKKELLIVASDDSREKIETAKLEVINDDAILQKLYQQIGRK